MAGATADGGARARIEGTRRRLHQLAERQRWVHHVGDIASGEVVTTELDRPVTPLLRARRLERAGVRLTPHRPGGPSFRLTSRRPYQASPEAYLVAFNASIFLPFDDTIIWEVPADHDFSPLLGLDAHFTDSPSDPAVLTVTLAAKAWPGRTGFVELVAYRDAVTVRVPIGAQYAAHTIDLAVPPPGPRSLETAMTISPGVELLRFSALSLRAGIVLDGVLAEP